MPGTPSRIARLQASMRSFHDSIELASPWGAQRPALADLLFGNPQELAMPELVDALRRHSVPQSPDWFAYRGLHPPAQRAAADGLTAELGLPFEADSIFLTRGAFGGIATSLQAIIEPGDEVIFVSPPWFFYEPMILAAGAEPVRVRMAASWDLDVDAIAGALTGRTRAVIINTPHNPTGVIYPPATLERLAAVLTGASSGRERPIMLICDQAYSRILFEGSVFHTPGRHYPNSLLIHTYSKSALAPGQRLGYIALPPEMPEAPSMMRALEAAALAHGFGFPDAVMQYALADIDRMLIDLAALGRKRDRLVTALRHQGYEVRVPEATFYLLPRSPIPDDRTFCRLLEEEGVLVLPGSLLDMPGHFRISLTATEAMIDRALPLFAGALERVAA